MTDEEIERWMACMLWLLDNDLMSETIFDKWIEEEEDP